MNLDAESYLKTGSNELRILEYRVAGMSFGVNILKVNKIVNDLTDFTKMPESHPAISGVFKDMGKVIPIIDLSCFLGLETTEASKSKLIVTEFFGMQHGFTVDRVDWIHHFLWEDVIDSQTVFGDLEHKYTIGIVKPTEDRMVQLLDYETILMDLCPNLQRGNISGYEGSTDFTGKRVLVVEDSPAVRIMMIEEMTNLGFEVVESSDGLMGWEEYQKQSFDLVISDVEMPRMDGLALTLRIRQSDRPDVPVIVYSSIGDVGMKSRAKFLKADAHITKLNLGKLVETADKLMRGEKLDDAGFDTTPQEELQTETVPID